MKLKVKILLAIVGTVIISNTALVLIARDVASRELVTTVAKQMDAVMQATRNEVYGSNEREFKMLSALASIPQIKDSKTPLIEKYNIISAVVKSDQNYVNISVYDKDGNSYTDDGRLINFSNREYFKQASKGKRVILDPEISAVTNSLLTFYSVPVYDENSRLGGTVTAVIDGTRPSKIIQDIAISENSEITLINKKTNRIVASKNIEEVKSKKTFSELHPEIPSDALNKMLASASAGTNFVCTIMVDGVKHALLTGPAGSNSDWIIVAIAPESDFFSGVETMSNWMTLVGFIITVLIVLLFLGMLHYAFKPLGTVEKAMKEISSGNADLTKRIDFKSNDEIGSVVEGFNTFSEKLQKIIADIKNSNNALVEAGGGMNLTAQDTAASITEILANIDSVGNQITNQAASVEETASAVNQIASNIESLKQMIETQSSGVVQASAAVEEMISNISSVNQSMEKMASSFAELESDSKKGSSKQKAVNEKIEQIESQSQMLQEANTAIANIAAQTNLLAMNAAIEAAHAGEAGKGFSVVADEIRKLSETSSGQSKTIAEQLNKILGSINGVVQASEESSSAFNSVSNKIATTDELVRQIKSAMDEQHEGSKQIVDALHSMNDSTTSVRSAATEMSAGNQAILEEVHNLQTATMYIKESVSEMGIGAGKINATGEELATISKTVNKSIEKIDSQINQFKI